MALKGLFRPTHTYGANCRECGLDRTCRNPRIPLSGRGEKSILLLGGTPGAAEESAGAPFRGSGYDEIRLSFRKMGIQIERDCWMLHSVCCRLPEKMKGPTPKQMKICRSFFEKAISELKPKHIVCIGTTALKQVIGDIFAGTDIDVGEILWRGLCIPDYGYNAWIYPILSPKNLKYAYNDRGGVKDQGILNLYFRDIQRIAYNVEDYPHALPAPLDMSCVRGTVSLPEVRAFFAEIEDKRPDTSFDYETTGLKPYVEGHTVATIGISTPEKALAFPFEYPGIWTSDELQEVDNIWTAYLNNKNLPKVNHNVKFEYVWSKVIFGTAPKSILACTMQDSHIIDERKQHSKLKKQAYLNFGVRPYHTQVDKFLESSPDDAKRHGDNAFNKVMDAPLDKLLFYNAQDAYYTMKLFERQENYLSDPENHDLLKCSGLFLRTSMVLARIQIRGVPVDEMYYHRCNKELEGTLQQLGSKLIESEENKKFKRKFKRNVDWSSVDDLRLLLYDVLGFSAPKKTEKGDDAVDKEVLNSLKGEFPKILLEWRKISKVHGTYLAQFLRESHSGEMHPNFDLHTTRTGRSSSSAPNFQNIPARDDYAKGVTRKGIIPLRGYHLLEVDFGSLEVRIIACYTQDKNLVAYINDDSTDMHRDEAIALFLLDEFNKKDKAQKMLRFHAKNSWVFAEFYTSYYKNCARNLWENASDLPISVGGITVKEHLKRKGIMNLADFTEHCKEHEAVFWTKFAGVRDWQDRVYKEYLSKGYTESHFGFRRNGKLTRADVVNAPIQGTAFHCLCESLCELDGRLTRQKALSTARAQIHDCIVGNIHPTETVQVCHEVTDIMVNWLRSRHDWMIVPMEVELELCKVNEPWYYKSALRLQEIEPWLKQQALVVE